VRGGDDPRANSGVGVVGKGGPEAGSLLNQHIVSETDQLPCTGRGESHPLLRLLDLLDYTDSHPVHLPLPIIAERRAKAA
jgi:hypothetical protein